jgi:hypothetical protein
MSPQLLSNIYNKTHDKLKSNLEMEIFVETHTWKKVWRSKTTTKLRQSKEKIETLLKFGARQQHSS